jgi:probable HAF family extracellular repeat protein
VLYSGGTVKFLGDYHFGPPTGINNAGQIIGTQRIVIGYDEQQRQDIAQMHPYINDHGKITDLDTLNKGDISPRAINNAGQVIGTSGNTAFLYKGGKMIDLGTIGGNGWGSYATGINDQGLVVGVSTPKGGNNQAFLYKDGVMMDLNKLIPPEAHWQLLSAAGINNKGQIIAWGINPQGAYGGALLTPAPEPGSLALLGMGSAGLLGYAWRRRGGLRKSARAARHYPLSPSGVTVRTAGPV